MPIKPLRFLSIIATALVLVLLVTSDFNEPRVTSVSQISPGSDEVRLVCSFVSAKRGAEGWAVVLQDSQERQVRGYAANGVLESLPTTGAIIEVVADLSWDDGLFLFIREVSPVRV